MIRSIDASMIKDCIPAGANQIFYKTDKVRTLTISPQKTGFGIRYFLVCPACGRRFQRLYLCGNRLLCRTCGNIPVYRGIQNSTKGGYTEIEYRMERFAGKHDIEFTYPFDYMNFLLDERVHSRGFRDKLRVLQALENMRFQCIFFRSKYGTRTVRSVLTGRHPLLLNKYVTLKDLRDSLYIW